FIFLRVQAMTKSELIEYITEKQNQLPMRDVELAVKLLLEYMSDILASGERIEIRGFGSFSLHYRAPRMGRNPKTGESVMLEGKYVPHFKPGKEMRDRVNESLHRQVRIEFSRKRHASTVCRFLFQGCLLITSLAITVVKSTE